MRVKSAGVSGFASGSASAAARRSSAVIASSRLQSWLAVLLMVLPLLKRFRPSRRDQANALVSHCVNDDQEALTRHTDEDKSVLAVFFAIIDKLDCERVIEDI